jgi:hypothetical protein
LILRLAPNGQPVFCRQVVFILSKRTLTCWGA